MALPSRRRFWKQPEKQQSSPTPARPFLHGSTSDLSYIHSLQNPEDRTRAPSVWLRSYCLAANRPLECQQNQEQGMEEKTGSAEGIPEVRHCRLRVFRGASPLPACVRVSVTVLWLNPPLRERKAQSVRREVEQPDRHRECQGGGAESCSWKRRRKRQQLELRGALGDAMSDSPFCGWGCIHLRRQQVGCWVISHCPLRTSLQDVTVNFQAPEKKLWAAHHPPCSSSFPFHSSFWCHWL